MEFPSFSQEGLEQPGELLMLELAKNWGWAVLIPTSAALRTLACYSVCWQSRWFLNEMAPG